PVGRRVLAARPDPLVDPGDRLLALVGLAAQHELGVVGVEAAEGLALGLAEVGVVALQEVVDLRPVDDHLGREGDVLGVRRGRRGQGKAEGGDAEAGERLEWLGHGFSPSPGAISRKPRRKARGRAGPAAAADPSARRPCRRRTARCRTRWWCRGCPWRPSGYARSSPSRSRFWMLRPPP